MLDLGLSKMALIGVVALVVIGPEKLPRVARTVGNLLGRAQRYVADIKSEVSREIELEEFKKMQQGVQEAAHTMHKAVQENMQQTESDLNAVWTDLNASEDKKLAGDFTHHTLNENSIGGGHKTVRKNWRIKQSALPQWYKRSAGTRTRIQSGAARMARYRYRPSASDNG